MGEAKGQGEGPGMRMIRVKWQVLDGGVLGEEVKN